jgi:drug/metabolite transporter (DMT)-like permease
MRHLLKQPVFLLLATGFLIGLNFPLGKLGAEAGVSPVIWAGLISLGASATLLPVLALRAGGLSLTGKTARYALISGLITFVVANLIVFTVIPRVGSGFTGLMFALSPVFTLALAVTFRLSAPNTLGIAGIAIGFAGATIVALSRQNAGIGIAPVWMLAALAIPVTLAVGNVYRTIAWPTGAAPDGLAFWSHLASLAVFAAIVAASGGSNIAALADAPSAAAAQFVVAGLTFPVFFRLQQFGGPVLLSQLGYVAAAVGLIAATVFLGESYRALTWTGAGVIALGIGATVLAQRSG